MRLSWQHAGVVSLSLQADDNVALEDIPGFGVCYQPVMFFVVYLCPGYFPLGCSVAPGICSHKAFLSAYCSCQLGVVYNHHFCLCDVHRHAHLLTFI